MIHVEIVDHKHMNLLGYFLKSILDRNIKRLENRRAFWRIRSTVLIKASEMRVTVIFRDNKIEIVSGERKAVNAFVGGSLDALFQICLGGNLIIPVLTGRIKMGGNVLRLIPLLKLLRV